jgi:hypothetical protein
LKRSRGDAELAPQMANVNTNQRTVGSMHAAKYVAHEFFGGHDSIGVGYQVMQNAKLHARQTDGMAIQQDLYARRIEGEHSKSERSRWMRWTGLGVRGR